MPKIRSSRLYVHVTFKAKEQRLRLMNLGTLYKRYEVGRQQDKDTRNAKKDDTGNGESIYYVGG